MIRKYIAALIAVLLIFAPAPAFAVEQDNTFDDGTGQGAYYEEPWQEQAPYDNTYEEPGYGENYQNDGYQNNDVNGAEDNTYSDGYNNQYEEPYTQPYTEPEYTEPYTEPYEEPYTEPEVYTEPYTEPYVAPEPEVEEEDGLSINAVQGEGYTVSGIVTDDSNNPAGNVTLLLSGENESIETVSNEQGDFTFTDVANGVYTLSTSDSEAYEAAAEPVEVAVENRNKLGYEIAVIPVEAESEPEEEPAAEEAEDPKEEQEEELPVEEAETEERASDASDGISTFELVLISGGTILLIAAIGIAVFRKISVR